MYSYLSRSVKITVGSIICLIISVLILNIVSSFSLQPVSFDNTRVLMSTYRDDYGRIGHYAKITSTIDFKNSFAASTKQHMVMLAVEWNNDGSDPSNYADNKVVIWDRIFTNQDRKLKLDTTSKYPLNHNIDLPVIPPNARVVAYDSVFSYVGFVFRYRVPLNISLDKF